MAEDTCGAVPVLALVQGTAPRARVGLGDIIAAARSEARPVAGQQFCRLSIQDLTSWLYPSLLLSAQGINPLTDLGLITDQANDVALLTAVYEGDCAAAALPAGELDDLVDDLLDELADAQDEDAIERDDITAAVKVLIPPGHSRPGVWTAGRGSVNM